MYGQIDCDYNQFMWILLPEAFFTRQYGNSETIPWNVLREEEMEPNWFFRREAEGYESEG